ncbi:hypothetical protein GIB67_029031 [Kingdonia uniflora]|uniref:Uncharacterized protein n=1 Tax=Kingdonia uniflora TaxID=39325 RepID=A0A7J7N6T9_9MAGN|nr:hypothetical protein GIB67_029031 [Kingdonia uniflora]
MATASLIEPISFIRRELKPPSLKWNPLLQSFPIRQTMKFNTSLSIRSSKFSVNCVTKSSINDDVKDSNENMFVGLVLKALKALQKPAAAAIVLGLLLTCDPYSALAASGGRMGGRSFSSQSSSSSRGSYLSSTIRGNPGFSYSVPYYAPSPFGFAGPAIGVGAGSGVVLLMAGFAAFILVSGFLSDRSEGSILTATQKTTVLKLQVGLLGMARSFQKDLDKIAEIADTSTSEGLSYVLTETTLALLRHPDCCISCYSSVDVKRSIEDGEKRFNKLSIEERGKFNEETLVNVNNIKRQSTRSQKPSGFSNEYIVKQIASI